MRLITLFFFIALCSSLHSSVNYIVQDVPTNAVDIKNWRDAHNLLEATRKQGGNIRGLENLWLSGSGAVNVQGFKEIRNRIQRATNNQVQEIIVLDLREESHGFLNNNAIALSNEDNWLNHGKTRSQTLSDEQQWLAGLRQNKEIGSVLLHSQFKKRDFSKTKTAKMQNIVDEKTAVEQLGMTYVRLTVTDHMVPQDVDVKRFIKFVKNMKAKTWLHIHCLGGKGRTTTFMTMYDILQNADKASLPEIVQRQASVPPYFNVLQTRRNHSKYAEYYRRRAEFIRRFYERIHHFSLI